jgi:phage terminase small subunit
MTQYRATAKTRVFVEAYLRTWNARAAAEEAGYAKAYSQGPRLLKKEHIASEISARLTAMTMQADEVLARLSQQATASIGEFLTDGGDIDWEKIKEQGHLVKSVSQTDRGWRLELHDGQAALTTIGKYHKLFADQAINNNVNVTFTADDLAKAQERARAHESKFSNPD